MGTGTGAEARVGASDTVLLGGDNTELTYCDGDGGGGLKILAGFGVEADEIGTSTGAGGLNAEIGTDLDIGIGVRIGTGAIEGAGLGGDWILAGLISGDCVGIGRSMDGAGVGAGASAGGGAGGGSG
jgi:hypothetical protein